MVDEELARRLLGVLRDSVADLRRYRGSLTREGFRSDRDAQHMVQHALYLAAQAAIDLALHWLADEGLPRAQTYGDAFEQLARSARLDDALAGRLRSWAGLRNVLAHLYATVDPDLVFGALDEVGDLEAFAAAIAAQLPRRAP